MVPQVAWALVAAALAMWAAGMAFEEGPRDLHCSKPCCGASCKINCTWKDSGTTNRPPTTLYFCRGKPDHACRSFKVDHSTSLAVQQDRVYALENSTVFVERLSWDGQRRLRSENRTFLLILAVQFPQLKESEISFGRSNASLRLTWPETRECVKSQREKEVRIRPQRADNWTQGNCYSGKNDGIDKTAEVVCLLERDVPYEVQARHRIFHWSSHWSQWSAAVAVPCAIARSPKMHVTAGRLREDGMRNVTLQWERPGPDHGEVNFILIFTLLPCQGCETEWVKELGGQSSFKADLSGAAYNISLQASNKAGSAPASSLFLPPAQKAGPIALNVNFSGPRFMARWQAPLNAIGFCFESHALGEAPPETPCTDQELEAGSIYENSGMLQLNQCYRLAVHGMAEDTSHWSTFGSVHVFYGNAALEMPIHLEVGPDWARVRWKPPHNLSACPGATQKYVLCRRKVGEAHTETTYYNTSASSREFTFQNLDPQTAYLAGVWASTAGEGGGCWPHVTFATTHPDSKPKALDLSFLSLGIFIAFLMAAGGFHFSQKRIKASLWPPLPDPSGTQAVKILPALGQGQMHLLPLLLPSESGDPSEPLLVVEEGEGGGEEGGALEKVPPQEEAPLPPTEVPPPPEYKSQGLLLLGPTEEEEEGPTHTGHEGPQADLG